MNLQTLQFDRLYIHVPFCSSKCDYCAFHSLPSPDLNTINAYLSKLDCDLKKNSFKLQTLKSLFIGGGTPSYLSVKQLKILLDKVFKNVNLSNDAEVSIECNPSSLTDEKIKVIADYVNRVSLGIQTFDETKREVLGRSSSLTNLDKKISLLISRKIDNISADFIYGIPGQSLESWKYELEKASQYPFKHISAYALTFEENTELIRRKSLAYEYEDLTPEMWHIIEEIIKKKNFKRYEVSNYSLPGYECQHNLGIWFGCSYLGLGPTASSFDGSNRWSEQNFHEWINGESSEIDIIPRIERIKEIFIMGLRSNIGWNINIRKNNLICINSKFNHKFYLSENDWNNIKNSLDILKKNGLVSITNTSEKSLSIRPTNKGMLFWNEIGLALI